MEQKKGESSSSKFPREPIDGGVSVEQLKELLEAELSKDAAEIDTEYVDELVKLILEAPAPEAAPSPAAPIPLPMARHNRAIRRMAGIAAMIVLVCTVTGITQAWVKLRTGYVFDSDEQRIEWQTNLERNEDPHEMDKRPLSDSSGCVSESPLAPSSEIIILDETNLPEQLYGHPVIDLTEVNGYSLNHAMIITDATYVVLYQSYNTPHGTVHIQTTIFFDSNGNFLINTETTEHSFHTEVPKFWKDHDTWSAYIPFNTGYYFVWGVSEQEIKFLYDTFEGAVQ